MRLYLPKQEKPSSSPPERPERCPGAYRDAEVSRKDPLGDTLVALCCEVEIERIVLTGLDREAVTNLDP